MVRWADNHCHLDPSTASEVIREASEAGVERLVTVGTDVESSRRMIDLAGRFPQVWATAGVHPHDAAGGIDGLVELLAGDRVVAVGECGLDYHYDHSPRATQREVFAAQVRLAHERSRPLVIHSREAWDDTFSILGSEGVPTRTVFHCFTGGVEEAERALGIGCHLSFSGIVSFPSASEVAAAAARCPADRLLVETDAPYLAPVPHRGKRNRPAWVVDVGAAVARARGVESADVAEVTWANTERFYDLF